MIVSTVMMCAVLISLLVSSASAGPRPRDKYKAAGDSTLTNGITVLSFEDKSDPLIAITVLYDVGGRDDPSGKSGLAKVCEWIMNNGSLGYWKGERERLLHAAGGSFYSQVWQDNSTYSTRFPKDLLRQILLIEADRLENPLITRETVEAAKRSVIREGTIERENNVYSALTSETLKQSYTTHPYRNDEYGLEAEVRAINPEDVRLFMRRFYQPSNMTLAIVGNFKNKNLLKEAVEIFDDIPSSPKPEHSYLAEPEQTAERRATVSAALQTPVFIVSFHTPSLTDPDRLALEVLSAMLVGNRSSFLYQRLVTQSGLCFTVGGAVAEFSDPSLLYCYAFLNQGVTFAEAETALLSELKNGAGGALTAADLTIAKNQMEARFVASWSGALGRSAKMARSFQVWGDGMYWLDRVERIDEVSLNDVLTVAQKYLRASNRSSIFLEPYAATNSLQAPDDE
ncbi:insulinase family protein, partial [bacterium AH-315-J21]|nr:insulinase family protein [bacterium AH-315-J21]